MKPLADPAPHLEPLREAFWRRSSAALARLAAEADPQTLTDALAAVTDIGGLARVLGDPRAVGASVLALDPLAPLIARNSAHRAERLGEAGGALSSTEVAEFLGVSRQAVEKRRRAHGLLAMKIDSDWRYPRCQFDEASGEAVSGLPKLVAAFASSGPWVTLDLLLSPDDALGGETPLATLKRAGFTAELERLVRIEGGDGFA